MRFPGGAALYCWGGGAAWTASSEKADGSPVTKVNLFYNGWNQIDPGESDPGVDALSVDARIAGP